MSLNGGVYDVQILLVRFLWRRLRWLFDYMGKQRICVGGQLCLAGDSVLRLRCCPRMVRKRLYRWLAFAAFDVYLL